MDSMRWTFGLSAAVTVLTFAGCGGDSGGGGAAQGGVEGSQSAVTMKGVNESSEFGTASLFSEGEGKTRVLMDTEGPFDREFEQPVEIIKGECPEPTGEAAYTLNALQDGVSETTIDASLSDLQSGGYVIIVRKSPTDKAVTECGAIAAAS
jgi:hypothetical protein